MSLVLTVTDLATNPPSVLLDVSGSNGDAWVIEYTPVDRPWPGDPWIEILSFAGDFSDTMPIDKRLYFFYAKTTSEITQPQIVAITDGQDALATRCRAATVAMFKLLNLPNIGDRVYDQMFPDDTEVKFPCVIVCPMNMVEQQEPGTNAIDTIGYGSNAQVFDNHQMTDHSRLPEFEKWRELLARAFRNMHLPGVPESIRSTVEYGNAAPPQGDDNYDMYVGSLIVRNFVRDARGMGA